MCSGYSGAEIQRQPEPRRSLIDGIIRECTAMITSTYKHGSYLHFKFRSCSFNFKNGYLFAATKVQILLKEVFARGPTRALSGSYVVNWSLVLF